MDVTDQAEVRLKVLSLLSRTTVFADCYIVHLIQLYITQIYSPVNQKLFTMDVQTDLKAREVPILNDERNEHSVKGIKNLNVSCFYYEFM